MRKTLPHLFHHLLWRTTGICIFENVRRKNNSSDICWSCAEKRWLRRAHVVPGHSVGTVAHWAPICVVNVLNGFVFVSSAGHVPPPSITWYRYHGHLTFILAILVWQKPLERSMFTQTVCLEKMYCKLSEYLKVKRIHNGIEVSHSHHFQWSFSYGWSCWLSTRCRTVYVNASVFEPATAQIMRICVWQYEIIGWPKVFHVTLYKTEWL